MALYRLGQTLPAEHGLEVLDVVPGTKLVYQLLKDAKENGCYLAFNATVMAIGMEHILAPFMEEKRKVMEVYREVQPKPADVSKVQNGATPLPTRVTSNTP